jgi:16S rRNA (cytosine1402-N4)-methyltransferase
VPEEYHIPVLLNEVMEGLNIDPDGTYVDCTFGGGGHTQAILTKLSSKGRLVAFDQDEDAKKNLPDDERLIFVSHNFRHLQRFLRLQQIWVLAVTNLMKRTEDFPPVTMRSWI